MLVAMHVVAARRRRSSQRRPRPPSSVSRSLMVWTARRSTETMQLARYLSAATWHMSVRSSFLSLFLYWYFVARGILLLHMLCLMFFLPFPFFYLFFLLSILAAKRRCPVAALEKHFGIGKETGQTVRWALLGPRLGSAKEKKGFNEAQCTFNHSCFVLTAAAAYSPADWETDGLARWCLSFFFPQLSLALLALP